MTSLIAKENVYTRSNINKNIITEQNSHINEHNKNSVVLNVTVCSNCNNNIIELNCCNCHKNIKCDFKEKSLRFFMKQNFFSLANYLLKCIMILIDSRASTYLKTISPHIFSISLAFSMYVLVTRFEYRPVILKKTSCTELGPVDHRLINLLDISLVIFRSLGYESPCTLFDSPLLFLLFLNGDHSIYVIITTVEVFYKVFNDIVYVLCLVILIISLREPKSMRLILVIFSCKIIIFWFFYTKDMLIQKNSCFTL